MNDKIAVTSSAALTLAPHFFSCESHYMDFNRGLKGMIPVINRQYTGDIVSLSINTFSSSTNSTLLMSTKHFSSGKMLLVPNSDGIHTIVQVRSDNASLFTVGMLRKRVLSLFSPSTPAEI